MTKAASRYLGGHINRYGRNEWRATITVGGKRLRRRATGPDALATLQTWIRDNLAHSRPLTNEELTDARAALAVLPPGCTLLAAAEAARRAADADGGRTVADAIADRLATAASSNLRPETLKALRHRLGRLADALGDRRLSAVTPADARSFLQGASDVAITRNGYRSAASSVFRLAQKSGYAGIDPFSAVPPSRVTPPPLELYTPDQVAAVLRTAEQSHRHLLPALPIMFFTGLRTAALLRLTASAILPTAIRVPAAIDKTRRTYLAPILPILAEWLAAYPPGERVAFPTSESRWHKARRECHAAAGVPVLDDGHRHSFASYRLAILSDAARVASEIGHWQSPETLFRHYYAAVTPDAAAAYFSIRPQKNGPKMARPVSAPSAPRAPKTRKKPNKN